MRVIGILLLLLVCFTSAEGPAEEKRGRYCSRGIISCTEKVYLHDLFPSFNSSDAYICTGSTTFECTDVKIASGCFPPSATVVTKGGTKTMDELSTHDLVFNGEEYVPVLGWIRREPEKMMEIMGLAYHCTDETSNIVWTSSDHFLYDMTSQSFTMMKDLNDESKLFRKGAECTVAPSRVLTRFTEGIYSPYVQGGYFQVDGVIVSCYSGWYSHKLNHMYNSAKYTLGFM